MYVAEIDNKIVGNIMYTKSRLIDSENKEIPVVSFGPVSVLPEYQRKGIAKKLLELAIKKCELAKHDLDYIEVNSSLYAVKIYERLGFTGVDAEKLINGIRFIPMKLKLQKSHD